MPTTVLRTGRTESEAKRLERACDVFARSLLMPEYLMTAHRSNDYTLFETYEELSDKIGVSIEAMIRRIGELGLTHVNERNRMVMATL